ncbi:MAG: thymidylate synthase [Candidatus Aenigmatarchaeota archaeon]
MENPVQNTTPERPADLPNNPYQPLVVEAGSIGGAWERAVRAMMTQGFARFVRAPEYQTWTMDNPMFIRVRDALAEPRISPKAPLTQVMANEYTHNLINGMSKEKENSFDYTYYSRLRHYPDCIVRAGLPSITSEDEAKAYLEKVCGGRCVVQRIDQVEKAIEIFKKDPTRRTVVMHTWIPLRDLAKFTPERKDTSSPCVVLMHPQLVEGKLHMNVVMKTNDLYSAWPGNAYAFTELQRYMAEKIGAGVGHYTHFSVAMQVYSEVFEAAREV